MKFDWLKEITPLTSLGVVGKSLLIVTGKVFEELDKLQLSVELCATEVDLWCMHFKNSFHNVATARSLESLVLNSVEYCLQHLQVEGGLFAKKVAYLNVIVTGIFLNTYNVICSFFVTAWPCLV